MLRGFLARIRAARSRAEGMFKLAELLWEEARRLYLVKMEQYGRALEKCSNAKGDAISRRSRDIELGEAEKLYIELHDKFPQFRRMDLVTYLIGFAAKEDNREDEAMAKFQEVIERFPKSPLFGDAWMMVGEHYFACDPVAEGERTRTCKIRDSAATSDLATFKTAWCYWKLGNTDQAAR